MFLKKSLITKGDLAVLLGVAASVLLSNLALFGQDCTRVRADVVRLHILADSDRVADQQVKLRVRDRILADVGEVFATPVSQSDAKAVATANLSDIRAAAQAELTACGVNEPVTAELCRMYFNTRQYDGLYLPAGSYDAVRVTIGSGRGKNWWCVMYPPICVPAASAETQEALAQSAELEEIVQLNGEPMFKPKLAVVELFERLTQGRADSKPPEQETPAASEAASEASEIE